MAKQPTGYKYYDLVIAGTSPMLMHNGSLASPLNEISKAIKVVSSKRKKTESDYKKMADLEFRGGLYLDHNGEITVPEQVLEAHLVEGAKVSREGQVALSSLFVEKTLEFDYSGPKDRAAREKDPDCRLMASVRVQRNKVDRCRPIFHDWRLKFRVSVLEDMVPEEMLERWVRQAGIAKGIGDWRPRYGRHVLESLQEVKTPLERVA